MSLAVAPNILKFNFQSRSSSSIDMSDVLAALESSQAIIEFKLDGTIITANENFLNVMGYALDEVRGHHHSMFAEPEFEASDEYKEFWEALNRGEFQAAQYKRLAKGGREV
jgi:methyl-accepting chemotaxis protein